MADWSFENTQRGYAALYDKASIRADKIPAVTAIVKTLLANREAYEAVQRETGVPWYMVGCIHSLESGFNFKRHLHNGDPLTARTRQVPAGRPVSGFPPFTWPVSAADALTMPPHSLNKIDTWSIARVLYELEKYNGFGYVKRGVNSPYLWSFTTAYTKGKYTADSKFSADAVSQQCGAAAILKTLAALGHISITPL